MPSREERERSFDDLYREARTSEGRARQQERIRQLDAQRRREAQQSIDEASRRDPPSGGSGVPPRGRRVFDFERGFGVDPFVTVEPIRVRDLIHDGSCTCVMCQRNRAGRVSEFVAATNSETVQWSNRPGEAPSLTLEALQRAFGETRSGRVWIENPAIEITPSPPPSRVRTDVCSLAKGCSGYCATCTRCLQHCTCPKSERTGPARRIRL